MTYTTKIFLIMLLAGIAIIATTFVAPIAQDPAYHDFTDKRALYGINNFWNVASNLPFILFGLLGLYKTSQTLPYGRLKKLQFMYTLFFTGAILVGFGSSYYHLNPSTETLFWDRLPIAITLMAFFAIVIAEYISISIGRILFVPLLAVGAAAVIFWFQSEQIGAGDLRAYLVVQLLPLALLPLILILLSTATTHGKYLWAVFIFFVLAKIAEHFDVYIYEQLNEISGHSLKHLFASLAVLFFYIHFSKQLSVNDE